MAVLEAGHQKTGRPLALSTALAGGLGAVVVLIAQQLGAGVPWAASGAFVYGAALHLVAFRRIVLALVADDRAAVADLSPAEWTTTAVSRLIEAFSKGISYATQHRILGVRRLSFAAVGCSVGILIFIVDALGLG